MPIWRKELKPPSEEDNIDKHAGRTSMMPTLWRIHMKKKFDSTIPTSDINEEAKRYYEESFKVMKQQVEELLEKSIYST